MDDKQITVWLKHNCCSTDIPAIAEALTNHAEWLLELAPDPIEQGSSCLPPTAAAGIFLGAAAMVHCGEASGAETWLEAAITITISLIQMDIVHGEAVRLFLQQYRVTRH